MCGRFTLRAPAHIIAERFQLSTLPELGPRFNIAPTQPVPVIRLNTAGNDREFTYLHWGLVPSWADDISIGNRMINARGETVASKPSFRAAFKRRRCLVIADGYYEWKKLTAKSKQPYLIEMSDGLPFAMAGLWESWHGGKGSAEGGLESCTIITTEANEQTHDVHDRMPVILAPSNHSAWLDPDNTDYDALQSLITPLADSQLRLIPVGTYVNNPRHDDPKCVIAV